MKQNGMWESRPEADSGQNTLKKCSEEEYCLIIEDNTIYEIDKTCARRKWGEDGERKADHR